MKPVRLISLLLVLQILLYPVSALEIAPPGMVEKETAPSSLGLDAVQALLPEDALELDGEALMLYELTTGTLVYGKGLDDRREPASVTKLMTCLLALKYGSLEDSVPVTASALSGMTASAEARAFHHFSNFARAKPVCSGQTHSEKLQLRAS
jgi:D-alanyl-D-alanine carboxypeptidase (penicillin-binding protein 5/6)